MVFKVEVGKNRTKTNRNRRYCALNEKNGWYEEACTKIDNNNKCSLVLGPTQHSGTFPTSFFDWKFCFGSCTDFLSFVWFITKFLRKYKIYDFFTGVSSFFHYSHGYSNFVSRYSQCMGSTIEYNFARTKSHFVSFSHCLLPLLVIFLTLVVDCFIVDSSFLWAKRSV